MGVRVAGIAVSAIALCCALPSGAAAQKADPAKQIEALQKIKRSLSPGERKLDGRLAVELRQKQLPASDRGRHRGARSPMTTSSSGCRRSARPCATWPAPARSGRRCRRRALRTVATWGAVERIEPAAQAMTARYGGRTLSKEERGGDRRPRCGHHVGGRPRPRRGHRARDHEGHRRRDEAVRAERRRRLARRLAGGRVSCRRSTSCRTWRATVTRARRCSRSCTTWRPAPSSASRPRSSATRASPTTSARCAPTAAT